MLHLCRRWSSVRSSLGRDGGIQQDSRALPHVGGALAASAGAEAHVPTVERLHPHRRHAPASGHRHCTPFRACTTSAFESCSPAAGRWVAATEALPWVPFGVPGTGGSTRGTGLSRPGLDPCRSNPSDDALTEPGSVFGRSVASPAEAPLDEEGAEPPWGACNLRGVNEVRCVTRPSERAFRSSGGTNPCAHEDGRRTELVHGQRHRAPTCTVRVSGVPPAFAYASVARCASSFIAVRSPSNWASPTFRPWSMAKAAGEPSVNRS